jgi:hypothetical protein
MMKIVEVTTQELEEKFLQFPFSVYRDDSSWIAPLKQDVKKVFDPTKNKHFEHGECARWILHEGETVIGRIAAFINHRTAKTEEQPTGGVWLFRMY